jgi:predicted phage terminase large subunit-like protein
MNEVDLIEECAIRQARRSFWAYRQYINGDKFKKSWFQKKTAYALQDFFVEFKQGVRPVLVIEAPPQHGKSKMVVEFITWLSGKDPDNRTFYTSFSDNLGIKANLMCQRIFESEKYKKVFPETVIGARGYTKNRSMIEFSNKNGFFRNTTVRGSITGEGLDLGVIDDPIKGRIAASSKAIRDATWDWLTDDFFTRFSEHAAFISILTRWHIDDPIGRLRDKLGDKVKVLSFPAIATQDEEFRKRGEALFPEHKSLDFLLTKKSVMLGENWEALYQQNPQIPGGNLIKIDNFKSYSTPPKIKQRIIVADTAATDGKHSDWSVIGVFGLGEDNKTYILGWHRERVVFHKLLESARGIIEQETNRDVERFGRNITFYIENASSGIQLLQELKRDYRGVRIQDVKRERGLNKRARVERVLQHIESGVVHLPQDGRWCDAFLNECAAFTGTVASETDDQVDVLSDALNIFYEKKVLVRYG